MKEEGKSKGDMGKSVMSPSDSREELAKNCGGFPETMDVKEIFAENMPPDKPAGNSVETRGSK